MPIGAKARTNQPGTQPRIRCSRLASPSAERWPPAKAASQGAKAPKRATAKASLYSALEPAKIEKLSALSTAEIVIQNLAVAHHARGPDR